MNEKQKKDDEITTLKRKIRALEPTLNKIDVRKRDRRVMTRWGGQGMS